MLQPMCTSRYELIFFFRLYIYRIESELKRRFSTDTRYLNILSLLTCVLCPGSYYEAVMLVLGLGLVSTILAPVLGLVDNKGS